MKFSWKLLNTFINIDNIELEKFKNILTLSGLEIESVDNDIIDLSITANRKEISSAFGLAREISNIFNIPLRILPINNKNVSYLRIINLTNYKSETTPIWLSSILQLYETKEKNLIRNIQEYIRLKWGDTFIIIDNDDTLKELNSLIKRNNQEKYHQIIKDTIQQKSQIIIFTTNFNKDKHHTSCLDEFYENMYIDSIKIISTATKIQIGKYKQTYQNIVNLHKVIHIKKKKINEYLGCLNNQKCKFIKTEDIIKILKQLNLSPQYNKLEKSLIINIPKYREHDLNREADIIEEIGRIYKFERFFKNIAHYNLRGIKSTKLLEINNIRKCLRDFGLHEVINCSLTKSNENDTNRTTIYNPISNEQQNLRINIIDSLISNYQDNIKHSKKNIEIFEIGKTFNSNSQQYQEIRKIGGLIYNNKYTRSSWQEQFYHLNFFHFKHIIETFLIKINSKAIMKPLSSQEENKNKFKTIIHLLKNNGKIGIYDEKDNKNNLIGIVGELKDKVLKLNLHDNKNVYIFEIYLDELINTIIPYHHINYITKKYSSYPSVTRDISIKMKKFWTIESIIKNILHKNSSFTESIEVLNEYKNSKKHTSSLRTVSLRITYRSEHKTLTTNDLQFIDHNLEKTLQEINCANQEELNYLKGKT